MPSLTKVVKVTRLYNTVGGTAATRAAAESGTIGFGLVTQFTY